MVAKMLKSLVASLKRFT